MKKFVGYYRVSTKEQGRSGLGLDAQQLSVRSYASNAGCLIDEITEVESGATNHREGLSKALAACRKFDATLVIARLDRLSRNLKFIAQLMEGRVDFVAVDMPTANKLTLHIIAAIAEHERDVISQRTRDALAAAKARGVVLGNPRIDLAQSAGARARKEKADLFAKRVYPLILALQRSGASSLASIARGLNAAQFPTQRSAHWTAAGVRNVLLRHRNVPPERTQ